MSSLRRSDAPPSLEASNQAQIDDLVQRNRTLEYTNSKLNEKLIVETNRSKEAVQDFQKRWHQQENLLREECEDYLAYYRFVQLSTVSALEMERVNVLSEQKALREEKLLRLQRDFRVAMFHVKERELEERVVELEDENERMVIERKALASALSNKLAEVVAQLRLKAGQIAKLSSERDVVEKDVSELREQNARLQTSLASTSSKLERMALQLEGAQSSRSELENINEDLKRKNYDLQRQIDKWQRLEHKSDTELDSLRERNGELEFEVKELQDNLTKEKESHAKIADKEQRRIERLKATTMEWKETAEARQGDLEDARIELAELRKELEELKSEQVRASVELSPAKAKKATTRTKKSTSTDSEAEQAPKGNRPTSRRKKGTASESETHEIQEVPPPPAKAFRKPKRMSPVVEEEEGTDEVVAVESPPAKAKEKEVATSKPKPRPKPRKKVVDIPDDEPAPVPTTKNQRKRKASADESDAESEKPVKKIVKTATNSERSRTTDPAAKKSSMRAASEEPTNTTVDPLQKTKKRKINVFAGGGSQSSQLGFDFNLGVNGFNIPTTLTPVKEAEGPVPNRTVSGVMSGLGITGLIRGRMGGTR
ncbi:hypothetical protein D9756_003477 [Leucocoprinus leucothites]|uniref:Uncharacterized protein n=1 Tax=Leucocoprinus leucothites TaxID=201217 RepID=A0A8H5G780_9AGAR|nr:hypothetical protein D9756_003477 [Leucoagaricus leucothites]